jgi:hypothetical protein
MVPRRAKCALAAILVTGALASLPVAYCGN